MKAPYAIAIALTALFALTSAGADAQQTQTKSANKAKTASKAKSPSAVIPVSPGVLDRNRKNPQDYSFGPGVNPNQYRPADIPPNAVRGETIRPPDDIQACNLRNRSFDAATNTIRGYGGVPMACP